MSSENAGASGRRLRLVDLGWELYAPAVVLLALVSLAEPAWLIFGPGDQGQAVDRMRDACQRGLERGAMAGPGFAAAGLIVGWAITGLVRLSWIASVEFAAVRRATRALYAQSTAAEISAGGRAVAVRVVPSDELFAFTTGLFVPTTYVSSRLVQTLPFDELQAVLLHEQSHVRCRDPLRTWLAGLVTAGFFLPGGRRAATGYALFRESHADREAALALGETGPLIRALGKVASSLPLAASGFNDDRLAELRRLRRLAAPSGARECVVAWLPLVGLLAIAVVAALGLSDWNVFWFCPDGGTAKV